MSKISTEWRVDPVVSSVVMGEMSEEVFKILEMKPDTRRVLDLGGGSGWFANKLRKRKSEIEVYSVDLALPRNHLPGVEYVRGNALALPFKDGSFDAVTAHAILHHVPDMLDRAMMEIRRVLGPDGVFLAEEPGGENFLGNFARKHFTTEIHEPQERPMPLKKMTDAISKQLDIVRVRPYTYLTYILPHISSRLPGGAKQMMRWSARGLYRLDEGLISGKMRKKAGYFVIIGRKGKR